MNNFLAVKFYLLITFFIVTTVSNLPINAAIKLQNQQLQRITGNQDLALSWVEIWNRLRGRKTPKGGRGGLCGILPQALENPASNQQGTQEIWSDKPLFLWRAVKAKVIKIEIFEKRSPDVFETLEIKDGATRVVYKGKPLQPGKSYEWRLLAQTGAGTTKGRIFEFTIMDSAKRRDITDGLTKLDEKQRGSVEKIALEKANFFAQKEMWTDALLQLYSVANPSSELLGTIKNIEAYDFCSDGQVTVSLLP